MDSAIVKVSVFNKVKADFDLLTKLRCEEADITTFNKSTNAVSYEWFFNGSTYSNDKDVRVNVDFASSNLFKLIVQSSDLCLDSLEKSIVINSVEEFKTDSFPNVFTPNGDGVNDLLDFNLGDDLSQCSQVYVYNRWGVLVFETRKGHPIWDGRTFSGNLVTEGVYFYHLVVNGTDYKGYITVLR